MLARQSSSIEDMEEALYKALRNSCSEGFVFAKFFYYLNESNNLYAYRNGQPSLQPIEIPRAVCSENICDFEGDEEGKVWC